MIFSDSPSQKALERMMTQIKGFPPRGSGVMVLRRFEYTAEMCDCRLCLYYNRKKKCTVSQCPCIEERIIAGAADRSEVMAEIAWDSTRPRSRQAAAALGTLWQQPCNGRRTAACNGRCRRKCRISSSQSGCFRPAPQSLSTRCRTMPLSTRNSSAAVLR